MSEVTKSVDQATLKMLEKAKADKVSTAFDRAEAMKPCPIGAEGSCCKNCAMGPCRVPAPKRKGETEADKAKRAGVCGATAETISARNFARMIAAGTASHSDHARGVPRPFSARPKEKSPGLPSRMSRSSTRWPWTWGWRSATGRSRTSPSKWEKNAWLNSGDSMGNSCSSNGLP